MFDDRRIYRTSPRPNRPKSEQRIFGKMRAFTDKEVVLLDGFVRGRRKKKTKDWFDYPGCLRSRRSSAGKEKDQRYPEQQRSVVGNPRAPTVFVSALHRSVPASTAALQT